MVYIHNYGIVKQKLTLAGLLVIAGLFAFLATFGVFTNANAASNEIVYDALPSTVPQTSYPSQPFQAQQTSEFGDAIHLGGSSRTLDSITVTMVTWARYSEYMGDPTYNAANWTHDITLTVYGTAVDANGEPTTVIAQKTQETIIPWRPEGDPTCPDGGYGAGFAWRDIGGTCRNGLAFNAVFNLSGLNVTLPDEIIVSIAYNTQTYGESPLGINGPYNSLNVAVPPSQPVSIGSDININSVFWNTATAGYYTNGGPGGYFREDTNWAPYGTVALQVTTRKANPTNANSCKKGGWEAFGFKNQGLCIQYVNTGKDSR